MGIYRNLPECIGTHMNLQESIRNSLGIYMNTIVIYMGLPRIPWESIRAIRISRILLGPDRSLQDRGVSIWINMHLHESPSLSNPRYRTLQPLTPPSLHKSVFSLLLLVNVKCFEALLRDPLKPLFLWIIKPPCFFRNETTPIAPIQSSNILEIYWNLWYSSRDFEPKQLHYLSCCSFITRSSV